ncbi:flagellin [Thermosyntropha lipolytica DSM 11003]|uniref:Flagellin n=1 Tax=Thermosyntropha lipolytica DSM 11003 TaxID=1123382 RepID=A0A1M5RLV1_9FIRM|nr:flagellin [Thermosyntropha lipolytica]SHH27304.1 flagellin [Thermosyntropha lipolytica DSM 11003]
MIINHNLMAMNTHRQLSINNTMAQKSIEKLSSGFRINRAGDDAAGLAISEKMRGQIRGLTQASRNAQDAISLIQTAEGALNEVHAILQRMRELAVQAANDTNTTVDRGEIQKEINQLTSEIDRIANTTEFNTQKLLDGSKKGLVEAKDAEIIFQNNSSANLQVSTAAINAASIIATGGTITITRVNASTGFEATDFRIGNPAGVAVTLVGANEIQWAGVSLANFFAGGTLTALQVGESITISIKARVEGSTDISSALSMQIGANTGQNITVGINSMKAVDLGLRQTAGGAALDITDYDKATAAITTINNALETVSTERSKLGAIQNRLEHTIKNLDTSAENLQAAESRIRDVDMAKEMMNFTKQNILQQAATAMLAQANQAPQTVLQLLR